MYVNICILRYPENTFFKSHQTHLHVPEGAVEKDGPSAGIAMTSSLLSLSLHRSLRPRLAMTGEISLTGRVLPVGGIKEKVLAARRAGADTVILPFANRRDFDELPPYVKESVGIHFVQDYSEVFKIAFESEEEEAKKNKKMD
jgi:ATP-dependent Lon protease